MLPKTGYKQPEKWLFPIDPNVDYRLPENRVYLVNAWAEAMYHTGELNQQLRLMDWAIEKRWTNDHILESKLWLAFLWGCCYNFTGPWVILNAFPVPPTEPGGMQRFADWYNKNFERIRFDTDCRYRKSKMIACVQSYVDWLNLHGGGDQWSAIEETMNLRDPVAKYEKLWEVANSWAYYGRLSAWNYLEAVGLVTEWKYGLDCQDFLLTDVSGSESNRNGVAFITDNEHLLTKHGKLKSTGETIKQEDCLMLNEKAEGLFTMLKENFGHIDPVLRFNTETVFCWVKKRFRETNTRYIGWDSERTIDEMDFVQEHWGEEAPLDAIYEARRAWLPSHLCCEDGPKELRGQKKAKMSYFYLTGTPMDLLKFQAGERWDYGMQPSKKVKVGKVESSGKTKRLW